MTLPVYTAGPPIGNPISLLQIQTEFGGGDSISISEYYAGGSYVSAGTVGYPVGVSTPIPSSGTISFANFHGASKRIPQLYTFSATGYFNPPPGMTDAQILIVGGGGRGGAAEKGRFNGEPVSGGGGGAGQVLLFNNVTLPLGVAAGVLSPVYISIGAGGTVSNQAGRPTQIYYYPNVGNSGELQYQAVGGAVGGRGLDSDPGTGGVSGNGFAGATPLPGEVSLGGGGGGATGNGARAGAGGPAYTVIMGGTTLTKGRGGNGGLADSTVANSGNGGAAASRMVIGISYGINGADGFVAIYG